MLNIVKSRLSRCNRGYNRGLLSGKKLILYSSICILLSTLFIQQSFAQAEQAVPYTLADRDRLIRLEEEQKSIRNDINTKFESLGKEQKSLRNEINTKFESLQTQINDLKTLIYFVLGSMVVLFGVMFTLAGFILWDRRTVLAPVKEETYRLAEKERLIEKILKEFAQKQPGLARILKTNGLI